MNLEKARETVEAAIGEGRISGCVLSVGFRGEIVGEFPAGQAGVEPHAKMTATTLFDVGTLTEPLATVSIFAKLTAEMKLNLNAPAARSWPEFAEEGKEKVSVRHLLKHTSGLPADAPYWKELVQTHPDWVGTERGREFILGKLSSEQLEYPPTYSLVRSELGYIALGHLAERLTGENLQSIFASSVAAPLSLTSARFSPVPDGAGTCAASGPCPQRGRMLAGEPADPNAWAMGGPAGHSGLFITASDAVRIGLGWVASLAGSGSWMDQSVASDFIGPKAKYKMGWEMPSREKPECGALFSPSTIGHVSKTGASLWVDLDAGVAVAFFATFLSGVPAWDPASVGSFSELLPAVHDAVRSEMPS